MAKQFEPLDDEEIVALANRLSREAVSFHDSELSDERENVLRYYDADAPKRSGRNNSSYVSQDVYDSVEQAVAALVDIFDDEGPLASAVPTGEEDAQMTEQADRYVDHIVKKKNDWNNILQTAVRDGLMNRTALGKVYWEEEECFSEEEFEGLTEDQVLVLAENDDVVDIPELSEDLDTGLMEGTLLKRYIKKQPRIDNIAPEEFGITPRVRCMDDAPIVFHRQEKTVSDLRKMGLSEDEIEQARGSNHGEIADTDPEIEQRYEGIDESTNDLTSPVQPQGETVWVYESYIKLDVDGDGITRLWRLLYAGSTLIEKEQVDDYPFLFFTPVPRSHSFWGNNWAERIIPTQNVKTTLVRSINDHTVATNKPRYQVVKGTLKTAQELMDDRFGGIVNVNRPDGIIPMPQAPLNPYTFTLLQHLQTDLEDTTGVSGLASGMSKDAVSNQNSDQMIDRLTSLSMKRLKVMARNFAEQWVKPMYRKVYMLAIQNDDSETILNINGDFVPVTPTQWKRREDFTVEIAVGYGEREKEAQKWVGLDALLTQSAPGQYGPQEKFRVLGKALKHMGAHDVSNYLNPEPPKPQPDPLVVAQIQMQERELALKEAEFQLKAQQAASNKEIDLAKLEADLAERRANFALKSDAQDLKEKQHEDRHALALEELAAAKATESRGILSPNS